MSYWQGKGVLVTGAARGIGSKLCHHLLRQGAFVCAVDLNRDLLNQLEEQTPAPERLMTFVCDITSDADIAQLKKEIIQKGFQLDALFNNAGLVFAGKFLDVPLEKHIKTYEVNTLGLVKMTYAFLPLLISRNDVCHLVNLSSATALVGVPYATSYASSKWAVLGFSESLRLELRELNLNHIFVTSICPSTVDTGLFFFI